MSNVHSFFFVLICWLPPLPSDIAKDLRSEDWFKRYCALGDLSASDFGRKQIRDTVFQILMSDPNIAVRQAAIRAIGQHESDAKQVAILRPFLLDPDLSLPALSAIVKIDSTAPGLWEVAMRHLDSKDSTERASTAACIQRLIVVLKKETRYQAILRLRKEFLAERDHHVKFEFASALLAGGDSGDMVTEFIRQCSKSDDAGRRSKGIQLVCFSAVPADIRFQVIRAGVNDTDPYTVALAIQKVPLLGNKARELRKLLENHLSSDVALKMLATHVLFQIDPDNKEASRSLRALIPILQALLEEEYYVDEVADLLKTAKKLGFVKKK